MKHLLVVSLAVTAISACGIAVPMVVGPPDLDERSAQAPKCSAQQCPFASLSNAESGTVLVKVTVAANGALGKVDIGQPDFSPHLTAAAIAVQYCVFGASSAPRQATVTGVYQIVDTREKLPEGVVRMGIQKSLQSDAASVNTNGILPSAVKSLARQRTPQAMRVCTGATDCDNR